MSVLQYLRENVSHRTVQTDASPKTGIAFVITPENIAVKIPMKSTDSIDAELRAVEAAADLLKSQGNVPTTFYTDCKAIVGAILGTSKLTTHGFLKRQSLLHKIQNLFATHKAWRIEWISGERNQAADALSRRSGNSVVRLHEVVFKRVESPSDYELYTVSVKTLCTETEHRADSIISQKVIDKLIKAIASLTGYEAQVFYSERTIRISNCGKPILVFTFTSLDHVRKELLQFLHNETQQALGIAAGKDIQNSSNTFVMGNPWSRFSAEKSLQYTM